MLQLTVTVDKFSNFFQIFFKIFARKKLRDVLYCHLLRSPNFQKDVF